METWKILSAVVDKERWYVIFYFWQTADRMEKTVSKIKST